MYRVATPRNRTESLTPQMPSSTSESVQLTQRERDIFSLVEFNVEAPAAAVARKLKIPVASVHYTLRRLLERGILRPRCFINSCRIGLIDVGFYFSLSEQSRRGRERLIARFKQHPSVAYIGSVLGDFQYVAVLMCRDLSHFSELITELTGAQDEVVSDKQIVPRLSGTRFARKYLSERFASLQSMRIAPDGESVALDDVDTQIVWALGNRPYESLRELARFLGLPLATVDRRVRKLREQRIIQGLFYDLNIDAIGVQSFRVLISIQGLSCSIRKEVAQLCAKHPLVTYLIEVLGSWDFEIGIETFDPRFVSSVVEELHTQSGGKISGVRVLMELEDFMCRHYPGKLGSGAPRA